MAFSPPTVTGYNANPPSDDGTQNAANEVTWAKHKTKIGDPIKTALEALMTELSRFFGADFDGGVGTDALAADAVTGAKIADKAVGDEHLTDDLEGALQGLLFGLTLSNNGSDATNDIDIAAGAARNDANTVTIRLASAITKRLDAAWAVGTGNGGLDTGSIADTTYHVWLIQRSDTGVVDVLFSTSATSPTMPTNYDQKRRIGSIMRVSNAIKPFWQNGDVFQWQTDVQDINVTGDTAWGLAAITVPAGIMVQPILGVFIAEATDTETSEAWVGDARDTGEDSPSRAGRATGLGSQTSTIVGGFFTNTSSQIHRVFEEGSNGQFTVTTRGWIDARGRL